MRFMMIVRATKDTEAAKAPSEKLIADMGKYNEELIKAGVMLDGAGLKPSSEGFRIHYKGRQQSLVDGPFAEAKELIAGYWVIQVASKEEAMQWAQRIPNPYEEDGEGIVEVRQFYENEDFGDSPATEIHHKNAELLKSQQ